MVTSSWLMCLPQGFTPEKFDGWYLGTHTVVAKKMDGLVHYAVNRVLSDQPEPAHEPDGHGGGPLFRIAQLWWPSAEGLRDSFDSYSGSAVRGDAFLNVSLELPVHPSIAITQDVRHDVARPAVFDTWRGGYLDTTDGTLVKVLAYGMADDPEIGAAYGGRFAGLGQDERVRGHRFGSSIRRSLAIGLDAELPGGGQRMWDWMLELSFSSRVDAAAFLADDAFGDAWGFLSDQSGDTLLSVLKGQEMYVSAEPIDHVDE